MSSKYDTTVDLSDNNNSHTLMIQLIGSNRDVLDVGCANGYLGSVLKERGCRVVGVEVDPDAAQEAKTVLDEVVVGDLEELDLVTALGEDRFDVVVFGDVLEHLRDPLPVLRQSRRLLKANGYVVISVPNVAHGAVRLALLKGEFEYRDLGLLDNTHLRFFTRRTLDELLDDAGLVATDVRRTMAGIFDTELGIGRDEFPHQLVRSIEADPEATTYQFVVKAVVDDAAHAVRLLQQQLDEHRAELQRLQAGSVQAETAEPSRADAEVVVEPEALVTPRVGLLGAFDLDDLRNSILMRVVRSELARRLPGAEVRLLAPYGSLRPSRRDGGEAVQPLGPWTDARAAVLAEQFDCIVETGEVGAAEELARRYGDDETSSLMTVLSTGLGDHEASCPVIWAGVSLPRQVSEETVAVLAKVLHRRRWPGSVVDDDTLIALQQAGTGPVQVVPDPVLLAPRVFTPAVLGRRRDYLRALRWLPPSGEALIVQADDEHLPHAADIAAALAVIVAERPATTIVVAELDATGGDSAFASALVASLAMPVLRLGPEATTEDIVAAVAAADGFVGTSPVALALSLAFQVPHIGLDLVGGGGLESFARTSGRPNAFVTSAAEIRAALAAAPSRGHMAATAAGIAGSLDTHFDELARHVADVAFGRGGRPDGARPSIGYVHALEAAHRALQARLLSERAVLGDNRDGAEHESTPLEMWRLRREVEALELRLEQVTAELEALRGTRMFRTLQPARRMYGRLRGLPR